MKEEQLLLIKQRRKDLQQKEFINQICNCFNLEKKKVLDDIEEIEVFEFSDGRIKKFILGKQIKSWYEALRIGNSKKKLIYEDYYYLLSGWLCWLHWSRTYVQRLYHVKVGEKSFVKRTNNIRITLFDNLKTIIDFGCGTGHSTKALSEIYPKAMVFGTNVKGSWQTEFAKKFNRKNNIKFVNGFKDLPKTCDLVLCSEYFEHFEKPIDHLKNIINCCHPKIFMIASSFNMVAAGHFEYFIVNNKPVHRSKIGKIFNNELIKQGYEERIVGFWNNRPNIWEKVK